MTNPLYLFVSLFIAAFFGVCFGYWIGFKNGRADGELLVNAGIHVIEEAIERIEQVAKEEQP